MKMAQLKCGVSQSYLSVYCQFCYSLYSVISIAGTYSFFVLKAFTEQDSMIEMFLVNICLLIAALTGYSLSHSLKRFATAPHLELHCSPLLLFL